MSENTAPDINVQYSNGNFHAILRIMCGSRYLTAVPTAARRDFYNRDSATLHAGSSKIVKTGGRLWVYLEGGCEEFARLLQECENDLEKDTGAAGELMAYAKKLLGD